MAKKRLQLFGNPRVPIWLQGPMDWYESIGVELAVTWGTVARWQWEVRNMRYVRGQTIWLEGTHDDIRDRRRAVLGVARGMISARDQKELELDNLYPLIPIDTISPRLANLICVAYKGGGPERTFSDSDDINKGFDDLYEELNINEVMDSAYRAALFTNTVLIFWSDEEQKFLVLTPEYFRIAEDGIWIARRISTPGSNANSNDVGEIVYDVWTNQTHEVRNGDGKLMATQTCQNEYGMFPGVLMKLTPSNDLYGAGIVEAADINAISNLIRLFGVRIALYQGFSVGVLKNYFPDNGGTADKNGVRVGPGQFLNMKNAMADASGDPDFKFVSPDPAFDKLEEFRRNIITAFERNQDLPGFLIDENAGTPPTGVALQVLERQLNDRREDHYSALRRTEKQLRRFAQVLAKMRKRQVLLEADPLTFEIQYPEAQSFVDPTQELTYNMELAENGLISPAKLARKYFGAQRGITDEDAVAMMVKNQQFFSFLKQQVEVKAQ